MPHVRADHPVGVSVRRIALVSLAAATALLGGCAGGPSELMPKFLAQDDGRPEAPKVTAAGLTGQSELERATEYWGKKFQAAPNNLEAALAYARNLKAMGQKRQALSALQQASVYHAQNRELAGEYGRLALELDQVSTAKTVLAFADDPTKPDWRVISARGTVLAKEGAYKDAIPYFERALALSNSNPKVMNNLAVAHALAGDPERSEQILRAAVDKGAPDKARNNLALVLGLQGRYDEAKVAGARVLSQQVAEADTALVRQVVKLEPRAMPAAAMPAPAAIAQRPATTAPAPAVAAARQQVPAQQAAALRPAIAPSKTEGWSSHVAIAGPAR
ncbi:MAG: tetratricopeptide repeat protein [Hyphomicrobiaceae bacterium]